MKKDSALLELFFKEPARHWHFELLLKKAGISRPQAVNWLRKFVKEGLVRRIKPAKRMPYYVANYEDSRYQTRKRLFALYQLNEQGFLSHLAGLTEATAVYVFGSISRWDWNMHSDIDVFIYGNPEGFDPVPYRIKLHREIETFICKDTSELKKLPIGLLRNILAGYRVKGNLDFIRLDYA